MAEISKQSVTGKVERMQVKKATNGGKYTVIKLKGKNFFDWNGYCEAEEVTQGDTVRIEHDGDEYPRVTSMEKLASGEPGATERGDNQQDKETRITRICALKSAARVLQGSDLSYEERVKKITGLAKKLEEWIIG